ncbi:Uncharacterized ferredoxin-like protein YfaE [Buchnera aphidicola (Takecallis arundicolens)]|uniref:2Fe-2S iron-sulfur cluster-binding protein n=1 Tax=Buchnera aphidicola TaxID=9 RepID=UPI0034642E9B
MNLKNLNYKKKDYIIEIYNKKYYIRPEQQKLSILQILLINHIDIFYQCNSGYCGSCSIKLVYGKIYQFKKSIAYVPKGNILACSCRAKSNIIILI